MIQLHPEIAAVTDRVIERSKAKRRAYLALIDAERASGNDRPKLGCANLAHAYAGTDEQRDQLKAGRSMNIGIVTA
ncbi:phosphogluconate dehydratase, partial [Escherichia coli]|nr:phosphogluconate dehydratase [Escherichia coli]